MALTQNSGSFGSSSTDSSSVVPSTCISYQCDQPVNSPCVFDLEKVEMCAQGFFCMPNLSGSSSDSNHSGSSLSSSASGSNETSSQSGSSLSSSASGSSNETNSESSSFSSSSANNSNETNSSTSSTSNVLDFNLFGATCVPKVDVGGNCTVVIGTSLSNCFDDLVCTNGTCQRLTKGTIGFNETCEESIDCISGNCKNQTCQPPTICIDGVYESTSCPFGKFLQCNNSLPVGQNSACVDWLKEGDECESSFQCSYDQICSVDSSEDSASESSSSNSNSNSSTSVSSSESGSNSTSSSSSQNESSSKGSSTSTSTSSTSSGSQNNRNSGLKYCRKQFTKKEGEFCSVYNQNALVTNENAIIIDNSEQLNRMDCDLSQGLVCNNGTCVKLITGADCSKDSNVCNSDYEKCICDQTQSSSSFASSASGSSSFSSSGSNSNSSSSDLSSSASNSNSNSSSSDLSSSGSNSNSNSSSSDLSSSGSNSNTNSSSSQSERTDNLRASLVDASGSSSNSSVDLSSSGSNSNSSSSGDLSSSASNSNSNSSSSDASSSGSNSNSNSSSSDQSGSEISTAKCVPVANYNSECQESLTKLTQCALDNKCSLGVPLTNSSCMIENCIQYFCNSPCFETPLTCVKSDICRFYYSGSSSASTSSGPSTSSTSSTTTGPSESDGSTSSYLTPSFALIVLTVSLIISNLL